MPLDERDAGYVWDMLDAARAAHRFIGIRPLDEYLKDEVLQAAVERKIEIVGEAARHVSDELKTAASDIPWGKITGQRHVLAHDYGRIQHDRIWDVVTVHIPELISKLEFLLRDNQPPDK